MSAHDKTRKSGFTIVELMAAVVATAIFSLAVGSMLVYAWMGWIQYTDSVQMQRDATLAMRIIEKEIRRTAIEGITPGSSLICTNAAGQVSISKNGSDLDMQVNAGTAFPLVRDVVTAFKSETNANGSVQVALGLDTGNDNSTITMTIYSRN